MKKRCRRHAENLVDARACDVEGVVRVAVLDPHAQVPRSDVEERCEVLRHPGVQASFEHDVVVADDVVHATIGCFEPPQQVHYFDALLREPAQSALEDVDAVAVDAQAVSPVDHIVDEARQIARR